MMPEVVLTRELCLSDQGHMKDYINTKFENLRDYVDDEINDVCATYSQDIKELRNDMKAWFWWMIGFFITVVILLSGILVVLIEKAI